MADNVGKVPKQAKVARGSKRERTTNAAGAAFARSGGNLGLKSPKKKVISGKGITTKGN